MRSFSSNDGKLPADNKLPFVSVIVPAYNSEKFVAECIECLLRQDYPRDRFEIIVVDNGSTDGTIEKISAFNELLILFETDIRSSYAARNRGLDSARGDIIAFTDSDCTPEPDWISSGVRCLEEMDAELAGGRVKFKYSSKCTASELIDSFSNMQIETDIRERNVAKTANLFCRNSVFENIGSFLSTARSGGDVEFTKRATDEGLKLIFCSQAVVGHPARRFRELVRKSFRTGYGKVNIGSVSPLRAFAQFARGLLSPPRFRKWAKRIEVEELSVNSFKVVRVGFMRHFVDSVYLFGAFIGSLHANKKLNP
ncbi:MAG TPA: glycosyltransferase [candidate division Zixibacteria bacterium]|nr:glycosyltransferase [candidate division Zixibacteria bacterium]